MTTLLMLSLGVLLGLWHFGSLFWLCRPRVLLATNSATYRALWQFLRVLVFAIILYFVALNSASALVTVLLGVLLVRVGLVAVMLAQLNLESE